MDMIKIACLGLSGVMMGLLLRQVKSPLTEVVSLCTCLLIIFYSVTRLEFVLDLIETAGDYLSLEESYFRILMKIVGITYIADFSAAFNPCFMTAFVRFILWGCAPRPCK